jgi:adenine-specific DNA-methyltransferase
MQGGYLLYSSPNISKMFIKKISEEEQQPFVLLVDEILARKKRGEETAELENEIDTLVYRLYDLTTEEIAVVEGRS